MKKFLLALIVCGVMSVLLFNPVETTFSKGEMSANPLWRSFRASGAAPYELKVQGWAKINNDYMSVEQLQQVVDEVRMVLGITESFTRETQEYEDMQGVTAIKELRPREYAMIIVQSLDAAKEGYPKYPETYLVVTLSRAENLESMLAYRRKIENVFEYYNSAPSIFTYITGRIDGELAKPQKNLLLRKMFEAAGAGNLEGINNENLVSYSGYTPDIEDYIVAGGKKVNLNIALRYHENEQKTYVYIGSPLLEGEY